MLKKAIFTIVGSVLCEDNPRDIDIRGCLSEFDFLTEFKMEPKEFFEMLQSGKWDDRMYEWARISTRDREILSKRMNSNLSIDFRYEPITDFFRHKMK